MIGLWDALVYIVGGVLSALAKIALMLLAIVVVILNNVLIWFDTFLINFWVVMDMLLGSLTFLSAPLSWALICGILGALVHLGCSHSRS